MRGVSWWEATTGIIRTAIRAYPAAPTNTLTPAAQCLPPRFAERPRPRAVLRARLRDHHAQGVLGAQDGLPPCPASLACFQIAR